MRKGLIGPLLFTIVAVAVMLGLGSWQLARLQWKLNLIERLEARARTAPVGLDGIAPIRAREGDVEYMRVRLTGTYQHDREVHLYATGPATWGWQVLTPLVTSTGQEVLVNRGFVPDRIKEPAARRDGLPAGPVTFVALLRAPASSRPYFSPENEPKRNRWYWVDPAQLLQPPRLPYVLEAEAIPGAPPPNGGVTRLEPSNPHLAYAFTWYSFAMILLVIFGLYARQALKSPTN